MAVPLLCNPLAHMLQGMQRHMQAAYDTLHACAGNILKGTRGMHACVGVTHWSTVMATCVSNSAAPRRSFSKPRHTANINMVMHY